MTTLSPPAHNDYMQLAAEGGLLLTIPAAICIGLFIRDVRRGLRETSRLPTGFGWGPWRCSRASRCRRRSSSACRCRGMRPLCRRCGDRAQEARQRVKIPGRLAP
jgi:hypothetical protein